LLVHFPAENHFRSKFVKTFIGQMFCGKNDEK
jgi:hypothetical protein